MMRCNAIPVFTTRLIYSYRNPHRPCVFLQRKRKVAAGGYNGRYNPVCTLCDLLRTRKSLRVLTIFPRICRACRPTPCPHFACNAGVPALLKRGEAGGPPRSFAQGRNRGASAPKARPLRSSTLGSAVLGWAHGVGRQSRRRRIVARWGALLALGYRQMRGGGDTGAQRTRLGRVAGAPRYSRGRVLTGFCRRQN
jgi:hypothetical protein